MKEIITHFHCGLHMAVQVSDDGDTRLLHLGIAPFTQDGVRAHEEKMFRLIEVQCAGENQNDHHGNKHTGTNPGRKLRYCSHSFAVCEQGETLTILQKGGGIDVKSDFTFLAGLPAVRISHTLRAEEGFNPCLEYVSSLSLCGLEGDSTHPDESCRISYARNGWCSELAWRRLTLAEAGLSPITPAPRLHAPEEYQNFSTGVFSIAGHGTWPSSEFLPIGAFERNGQSLAWQIESIGPWQWEISTIAGRYYLQAAGPDDTRHHWHKTLNPGDAFTTEAVTVGFSKGSREDALAVLNSARRVLYRKSADLRNLPVIFNEYMVSLSEPREENLIPLIEAAAKIGCEYFCIDAGWYSGPNRWWDEVGHWQPEPSRFPNGLDFVTQKIRQSGMVPGIWLEPEVMGIACPDAEQLPDEAYFHRNGRRVIDHGRYQLDFRHPSVTAMLDEIVDKLVRDFGIGYLKLDYNINGGYGTEIRSRSAGDGLLEHTRAYREWLRSILERYSDLVIENCASGGMRMTYGLLSLLPVQSLSDQDDPLLLAPIAAAAPSAVTPEQAAVWCLPNPGQSDEVVVFSMVGALLMRIHQSGDIAALGESQLNLISEAIECYKAYRHKLPKAVPFWPLGLPAPKSRTLCLGMDMGDEAMLAVWRYDAGEEIIPLPTRFLNVEQLYPGNYAGRYELINGGALRLELPAAPAARLLRLW